MKQDKIITLYTFKKDTLEPSLAKDKLKTNGIDSFLEDENIVGLNPIGGIELRVLSKDRKKADKLIAEYKN